MAPGPREIICAPAGGKVGFLVAEYLRELQDGSAVNSWTINCITFKLSARDSVCKVDNSLE